MRRVAATIVAATSFAAIACAPPARRPPNAEQALPSRLVLSLDGIDYRDVMQARREGLFADFREPSRLISTFPSISDVAWHDIFGLLPPRGYQRVYFSLAHEQMIGGALDAIRPIEFEQRMDMAFGGKFHHLSAYVASLKIAKSEVDDAVAGFFEIRGQPTVYVYNVGPDALQHTRGDLRAYLRHLDSALVGLQMRYRARTGRQLEIVVLSDHGHNKAHDAQFVRVNDALQAHGFRVARRINDARDVAFSVDGVTTGFGVFPHPDSATRVAEILAGVQGVDIVTVQLSANRFRVYGEGSAAIVEREFVGSGANGVAAQTGEHGSEEVRYRYREETGDPLRYRNVVGALARSGGIDTRGFGGSRAWLEATAHTHYPAALERIVHGHASIALNVAPVLVSLRPSHRVGLGMVSVANRIRPLGGTHGALDSTSALGVLMTNFIETRDDVTSSVRKQLGGFDELGDPQRLLRGMRLVNAHVLRSDRFAQQSAVSVLPATLSDSETLPDATGIEWWMEPAASANLQTVAIEVRRLADHQREEFVVLRKRFDPPSWPGMVRRGHWIASLDALGVTGLEPRASYTIRLTVRVSEPSGKSRWVEFDPLAARTGDRAQWPAY